MLENQFHSRAKTMCVLFVDVALVFSEQQRLPEEWKDSSGSILFVAP